MKPDKQFVLNKKSVVISRTYEYEVHDYKEEENGRNSRLLTLDFTLVGQRLNYRVTTGQNMQYSLYKGEEYLPDYLQENKDLYQIAYMVWVHHSRKIDWKQSRPTLAARRKKFVELHFNELKSAGSSHCSDEAKRLCELAREEVGYSKSYINQDLYRSLRCCYDDMKIYKTLPA